MCRVRLVCGLAAVLALGACGSDDDTTSSTPTQETTETAPMTDPTPPSTDAPEPVTTEPSATEPAATEPNATEPADTEPNATEPSVAELGATESVVTEPTTCRRFTDFADDTEEWFIVNDGVMGGRSNGAATIADSVLRFTGSVVTAGGGFTSVRLRLAGDELAGTNRIDMRVRPDGRTYGLTMEDAAEARGRSVSHRADISMGQTDDDGWTVATIAYDELVPSVFGQPVDAPSFDPASAREFGIIIADGADGDFVLEIDWIDACA